MKKKLKNGVIISTNNVEYKLIEEIGKGGSGVVWKALANGKNYAIKFINSDEKDKIKRFNRELDFCKKHKHENIVQIITDGEFETIRYYIMPFYSKTFRNLITEENNENTLLEFILQLCCAIEFAHSKAVIHRDIKPENILIEDNQLVLADFGIAHFENSTLTKKDHLLANRNYLSPEQKIKNNAKNIDKSADIYALGLIINESFTKLNPSGSKIKLIGDIFPLLQEFDTLVVKMTKQNASERFTISQVIYDIKFIHGSILKSQLEIKNRLNSEIIPTSIYDTTLSKIINIASEDILFAKTIFENKTINEIVKYNSNWHKKIGYSVDKFLFNVYMQEKIFDSCKDKFDYESNGYTDTQTYTPLNLVNNDEHKQIYGQFKEILNKFPLDKVENGKFDLKGKTLKLFASTEDYHCKEILSRLDIKAIEEEANYNLIDAPLLWIVISLKSNIQENINLLTQIDLTKHISLSWSHTQYFDTNEDDNELFDKSYLNKVRNINNILFKFQEKWNIVFSEIDDDTFSIKFSNIEQFKKFQRFANKVSTSTEHIGFKHDIAKITNNHCIINGIVELKLDRYFDIPRILSIILST